MISFLPSFNFWVCFVWCRRELNFSYLLLRSACGGEISRVLFVACLSGAIFSHFLITCEVGLSGEKFLRKCLQSLPEAVRCLHVLGFPVKYFYQCRVP